MSCNKIRAMHRLVKQWLGGGSDCRTNIDRMVISLPTVSSRNKIT